MTYKEKLLHRTHTIGNTICVGLDPVLAKIPGDAKPEDKIKRFYSNMLEAMLRRNILPAAVKPNMAYYEAHGIDCLRVLQELMNDFKSAGILTILDAKRGDIASTAGAYAQMSFGVFAADAVTVAPYMGLDSVKPFQDKSDGQGIYVLVRTSNPSAKDFEDLTVLSEEGPVKLYQKVAEKLTAWNDGNLGAVVGATAPAELEKLLAYWHLGGQVEGHRDHKDIPVLIPGVAVTGVSGGQGGSIADVVRAMRNAGSPIQLHLINSSSGINYAYEKYSNLTPADASVKALEEMFQEFAKA